MPLKTHNYGLYTFWYWFCTFIPFWKWKLVCFQRKWPYFGYKWTYPIQFRPFLDEIFDSERKIIILSVIDSEQNGRWYHQSPNTATYWANTSRNSKSWIAVARCARYRLCRIQSNAITSGLWRNCNSFLSWSWRSLTTTNTIRNKVNNGKHWEYDVNFKNCPNSKLLWNAQN